MRTFTASLIALILGTALGWYFGYTRPVARNSWRIAQITGWVPSQISDAYTYPDETFRKLVGTQQEAVARASLSALTCLEDGQTDRAKDFLAHRVADYYNNDYKLDASSENRDKFRRRIEEVSEQSPSLKQVIATKPK
jgi:hypothetical protein